MVTPEETYVSEARKSFEELKGMEPLENVVIRNNAVVKVNKLWANKDDLSVFYVVNGTVTPDGVKFDMFQKGGKGIEMSYGEAMKRLVERAEGLDVGFTGKFEDLRFLPVEGMWVTGSFRGKRGKEDKTYCPCPGMSACDCTFEYAITLASGGKEYVRSTPLMEGT